MKTFARNWHSRSGDHLKTGKWFLKFLLGILSCLLFQYGVFWRRLGPFQENCVPTALLWYWWGSVWWALQGLGWLLQGLVGIYVGWLEAVWMVGGPRRPNFNPFLTGHHSILCRRSQIIFHIKYYMWKRCEKKGSRYTINAMIRIYEEAANIIRTASKPSWTTLGLSIYGLAWPHLCMSRWRYG